MQLLSSLTSLDNVADGSTRKLLKTATSSGSGNAVTAVSISGDTLTYTLGSSFSLNGHTHNNYASSVDFGGTTYNVSNNKVTITGANIASAIGTNDVTNSVNSQIALTNPSSGTWYYPTWVSGATNNGHYRHNVNDGFRLYSLQGTASTNGNTILQIGNSTASGTAGNKEGQLRIYGINSGYGTLKYANSTSNATHILPSTGGTILNTGTTGFTQTLTEGTAIGTIKINGTSQTIYAPATGSVSTELSSAHQTYYLTGVQTTASGSSSLYNSYLSNTYTGVKYVTSASSQGGALYVDDREVVTGLYYEIS